MKNLYLLFLALCSIPTIGQTDSIFHMELFHNRQFNDFAYNSDHSFMALTGNRIVRWEKDGDTTGFAIPNLRLYSEINRLSDGNFLVFGKSSTFFGKATKIDSTGTVIWETVIDKGGLQASLYSLYEKPDGSLLIGGGATQREMIAHLTSMGDTTKVIYLPTTSFSGIVDIIPTSDGNYLGSGFDDDYPFAVKFDNNLDTLWTFSEIIFISISEMKAFERSNGNFDLYSNKHKVVLDANGQKVQDTVHLNSFSINKAIANSTGFLAVGTTRRGFNESKPSLVEFNSQGDSIDGFNYEVAMPIEGSYRRILELPDGNFAALGNNRDSTNTPNPGEYVNLITIFGTKPSNVGLQKDALPYLKIYPNPASHQIIIDGLHNNERITLISMDGQKMAEIKPDANGVYDIGKIPNGAYIIMNEVQTPLGKVVKN